jgi:hypothetical protein
VWGCEALLGGSARRGLNGNESEARAPADQAINRSPYPRTSRGFLADFGQVREAGMGG